jgi:ATP-dependent DNA helicase RecG
MISAEKLDALLAQDEGSRLELKKSVQFTQRVGQTLCAFANSGGGLLVIGAERKDGKTVVNGVQDKDETYQKIAAILPRLEPRPPVNYEEHDADGKLLLITVVDALPVSEVCFFEKNVYIRQGSVNVEIRKQDLVNFLRARGIISFEENRSPARLEDISNEKVQKHLVHRATPGSKPDGVPLETVLQSLGVANAVGEFYIKNAGVLAFAKDINRFFSNAEIRIVKYKGRTPSLQAREFDQRLTDTLPELLEKAFVVIQEKAGFSAKIVNGKRVEAPMIPPEALREALTNAVGHREYFDSNGVLVEIFDDRIRITNPGSLLPGQTLKNFADIRRHRNPIIHRILNDSGWGEGLNLGVRLIIRVMRENDLPDPDFEDMGGFFRVTLYGPLSDKAAKPAEQISPMQQKALAYLEKHESITAPAYARLIGISHPTAIRYLNDLVALGRLKKLGNYRSSRYVNVQKD